MTRPGVDAPFSKAEALLDQAVADGVCPAAVAEVGDQSGHLWRHAAGRLRVDDAGEAQPAGVDTVFDLASLTKVIATTTLAMHLVDDGALDLDEPIRKRLQEWRGHDRAVVTARDLLAHASGLTAHLPFFRNHTRRIDFEPAICHLPLEYRPRSRSIYSDLGFILLGFLLTDSDPHQATLDSQFASIAQARNWGEIQYRTPNAWRARVAPTEHDPWRGRLLVGEVHDENGFALGGVAGHSGLFGTAEAVGRFARDVLATAPGHATLASPDTVHQFRQCSSVPGSSRALGWDTMLPTSSCGIRMSKDAIGHTGFTGTSLWIDPRANRYVVLLTNRVHPTRSNDSILAFRPAFHDVVMDVVVS